MKPSYVYIMTNTYRTTFYVGVTSDLKKRNIEHKSGIGSSFTKKYNLHDLIYFETFTAIQEAIAREKQLKNWHRDWKINLIKAHNPKMRTLTIN
ncbi:GIY-YIG nuclease family protein [Croceivirga radicis]|uniref:GIY-YIG nuclease family protein n=1 Tax=Croceivirga radicis TaxID=1929488 RepID=UPI000255ABD0|nr:GIY-YIG nuclease family protein [Croceivirga radicis]